MYIWRGKNRRDHRNLATSSPLAVWGPPKGESQKYDNDVLLRYDGEMAHVGYFKKKTHMLMHDYLSTENGKIEIKYLVRHLGSNERLDDLANVDDPSTVSKNERPVIPTEALKKKNI